MSQGRYILQDAIFRQYGIPPDYQFAFFPTPAPNAMLMNTFDLQGIQKPGNIGDIKVDQKLRELGNQIRNFFGMR